MIFLLCRRRTLFSILAKSFRIAEETLGNYSYHIYNLHSAVRCLSPLLFAQRLLLRQAVSSCRASTIGMMAAAAQVPRAAIHYFGRLVMMADAAADIIYLLIF